MATQAARMHFVICCRIATNPIGAKQVSSAQIQATQRSYYQGTTRPTVLWSGAQALNLWLCWSPWAHCPDSHAFGDI